MAALLLAVASSRHAGPMVDVVETDEAVALVMPAGPRPALSAHTVGGPAIDAPVVTLAATPGVQENGPEGAASAAPAAVRPDVPLPAQQVSPSSSDPLALETTTWHVGLEPTGPPSIPLAPALPVAERAADDRSPWTAFASAGTYIGAGSRKAGTAVAGFFGRAAKTTGSSF
jgi:hypothetical protein